MEKIITIPRLMYEGSINPNSGKPYDTESFNEKLNDYINNREGTNYVCWYKPNPTSDLKQMTTIEPNEIMGKIIGFDKESIQVKLLDRNFYNIDVESIDDLVALFSILSDDITNGTHKITYITKVEIASFASLDNATRDTYLDRNKEGEVKND